MESGCSARFGGEGQGHWVEEGASCTSTLRGGVVA